jgi:hypothetical protein
MRTTALLTLSSNGMSGQPSVCGQNLAYEVCGAVLMLHFAPIRSEIRLGELIVGQFYNECLEGAA